MAQWLRLCPPVQAMGLISGRELISHIPRGQNTKNMKQKQYCNKFCDLKKKKRSTLKKKIADYIKKNQKKPRSLLSELLTSKQRQLSPRKAFPAPARTSRSPGASASQRLPRSRPTLGSLSPAFTDSFPEKLLQFLLKPFFPSQTQPCDRGLRQGGRPRPAPLQSPVTSPGHPGRQFLGNRGLPGVSAAWGDA